MQDVNSAVPGLELNRGHRIFFGHRLPEHSPKSDSETLYEGGECFAYFANDRWHMQKSLTETDDWSNLPILDAAATGLARGRHAGSNPGAFTVIQSSVSPRT